MWREPTEADVLDVLNAPETIAYQAAAKRTGQDVLAGIFKKVVDFCRGYIGDNPANQLAAGMTLPDRAMRPAMHLVRVDLLTRLGREVDEDRRTAGKEALRFFERVSDGKVQIEQPEGALDTSGPVSSVEVVSQHERQATRQTMAGL